MTATTQSNPPNNDNPLLQSRQSQTVGEYIQGYISRLRAGDFGILPIVFGLIIISIFFQYRNENFLSPRNFVNLITQMAGITTIAYGIVFVLLIGEIDLSVSYVSAVAGAVLVLAVTDTRGIPIPGLENNLILPWYAAIVFALLIAALIGLIQGSLIVYLNVPSFVVTLAGFLVWSGMVLVLLDRGGTLRVSDDAIQAIANAKLSDIWGWIFGIAGIAGYAALEYRDYTYRQTNNLANRPLPIIIGQVVGMAALTVFVVYVCNLDRGVPVIGILMLLVLVGLTFVARRTTFGRYVYAVGGNAEAARRAGINVNRIRLYVFIIASTFAGLGGVVLVSRLRSIATNAGGGDLLLNSIAAAVIGGTSLFGGRGFIGSAVLGALVIASLDSGMNLLGWPAGIKLIMTGIVLVIAVLLDSLSRRRQKRAGIA